MSVSDTSSIEIKQTLEVDDNFELIGDENQKIDEIFDQEQKDREDPKKLKENDLSVGVMKDFQLSSHGLFNGQITEDPLQLIERYERNISLKLGGELDLDSKFVLTNFKTTADSKTSSVKYNNLEAITRHCFPDENNELPIINEENLGLPKCMTVLIFLFCLTQSNLGPS